MQRAHNRYYNARRLSASEVIPPRTTQCLPGSYFNNGINCTNTDAQYTTGDRPCCCNHGSLPDKALNPSACIVTKPANDCIAYSYFNNNVTCSQPQAAYTMFDRACCCDWDMIPDKLTNPSVCAVNPFGPGPDPDPIPDPEPDPGPPSQGPYGCGPNNTCTLMTTGGMYGRECNGVGSMCTTSQARCNAASKICEPAPSDATGADIYPWATCDALCDVPLYECGPNNTCVISTTGTYTSSADCMAKSPCGKTTLNIHMGPFSVPKPSNASYSNPQYVYVWLGSPFTAYRTQGKVQLTNVGLTSINLQRGSGPDALVLEYVIVAVGNVQMNQPDLDTTGRMGNIPVPGIPVSNIPIKYDVVASTFPGYAMVIGKQGTKRNATYKSSTYGAFTVPLMYFNFSTVPGKTYQLAARVAYASDDNADGYFCGGIVLV